MEVAANVTLDIGFRAVLDLNENKLVEFEIKEVNTDE